MNDVLLWEPKSNLVCENMHFCRCLFFIYEFCIHISISLYGLFLSLHWSKRLFLFQGSMVSMAVPSDGSYSIEEGLVYSFPVRTKPDHTYEIIKDLPIDDFSREKMDITMKELVDEKNMAMSACQDWPSPKL